MPLVAYHTILKLNGKWNPIEGRILKEILKVNLSKDKILFSSPENSKLKIFTVSKNYENILL